MSLAGWQARDWADRPRRFAIEDNPAAEVGPVLWERPALGTEAVVRYDDEIRRAAARRGVDPNLIRAVMWVENARGQYFGANELFDDLGLSRTKTPMNINADLWSGLVSARPEPEVNIDAAAELLRRIIERIDNPTPAKVGTIWNLSSESLVNGIGADVARIYATKPWLR